MADFRKTDNSAPMKYPWEDDVQQEEQMGATGIFGRMPPVSAAQTTDPLANLGVSQSSDLFQEFGGNAAPIPAPVSRDVQQEPVVHKVVMGNSQTSSGDLLKLLRTNTPMDDYGAAPSPAASAVSGSLPASTNDGFTQLLRTLGGNAPAAAAASSAETMRVNPVVPPASFAPSDSGFTALFSAQKNVPPSGQGGLIEPSYDRPVPNGFQDLPGGMQASKETPPFVAAPAMQPLSQAGAGVFTQLFSAITPPARSSAPPEMSTVKPGSELPLSPPATLPLSSPAGEGSSFTQILSTLGQTAPPGSHSENSRNPLLDGLSRPAPPGVDFPSVTSFVPLPPAQSEPLPQDGNLTRLLRTLNEPGRAAEMPAAYAPPTESFAPPATGGSLFTQTYKKLDGSMESAPVSRGQEWVQAPAVSATQPFSSPFSGGSFAAPIQAPPAGTSVSTGPSEVTRILDASKLREMQRGGMQGQVPAGAPQAAQPAAPAPLPAMPAMPNMQWPPQMQAAPPAGQLAQFGGAIPMPQYTPPTMPAAQAPPAPAAAPAMGKLQQYLPLLLIIIIFLLVLILVTVVFLLKH